MPIPPHVLDAVSAQLDAEPAKVEHSLRERLHLPETMIDPRDDPTLDDWVIELIPQHDPTWDERARLDAARGTEEHAISLLEMFADLIHGNWKVPRSMDWQNESGAALVRRVRSSV